MAFCMKIPQDIESALASLGQIAILLRDFPECHRIPITYSGNSRRKIAICPSEARGDSIS